MATVYTNQSPQKLRLALGAPYPGKILPMDLAALGGRGATARWLA